MRLAFAFAILIWVAGNAEMARAGPRGSCGIIETLVELPTALATLRAGQGDPSEFKRNLARSLRYLGDRRRTVVFEQAELRAMRIFAGAVRKDWKLNGTSSAGRQIPGLTKTSRTIQNQLDQIVTKFGCERFEAHSNSPLAGVGSAPVSPLSLISVLVAALLVILGIYHFWRRSHQAARQICQLPALLRCGGICTATTILDISRGGAMVEAPSDGLSSDQLTLHLPGYSIASRVAWININFAGLTFNKMISARRVNEIANMSLETDQPENLTDAAPDCFQPGCHLTCETHRATTHMLQAGGLKEA